jgi:D-beta-D-heptose 7-phosphate kinase / D-beta-D-heptose 1-phosphate adenosyltransferase
MTPRLTVIGDVVLDREIRGRADRICPDSPAPVIEDAKLAQRPGAAGLAALCAARAGARVTLVTALVEDEEADHVGRLLTREEVDLVKLPAEGRTPTKTRVGTTDQCLVRIDEGRVHTAADLGPGWHSAIDAADAIVVSDYGKGVAEHPDVRAAVTGRMPLVWDPHPATRGPIPGCTLVTPNHVEAGAFLRRSVSSDIHDASEAARDLAGRWGAGAVAVTIGRRGAVLAADDGLPLVAVPGRPASGDACGAGDMFAVTAAVALAEGASPSEALTVAVDRAADFVAGGGVNGLANRPDRAGDRVDLDPLPHIDWMTGGGQVVEAVRRRRGTVVATGGCYDLLHAGHLATLQAARALGDCLVVLINDDRSVRELKGPGRPINTASERATVLQALACVDAVAVFAERDPAVALRRLRPDIWVKGGDYTGQTPPEQSVLSEWGGTAVTVPYLAGRSTTALTIRLRAEATEWQ